MIRATFYKGDCLEEMSKIPDKSVDLILTDPPFAKTHNTWDSVIPSEPMWQHLKRIIKPKGVIAIFANQPFMSQLIVSNIAQFKYHWVWNKNNSAGFAFVKIRPFIIDEEICIFGDGTLNYYPIMEIRGKIRKKGGGIVSGNYTITPNIKHNNVYYPKNILQQFGNASQKGKVHPTQKPVDLLEYLIRTYTLEGDTVLDFTFGSCSTGVACINTNRQFIGIELDTTYYQIGVQRVFNMLSSKG